MTGQAKRLRMVLIVSWLTFVGSYLCRLNLSTVLDKLALGLGTTTEYLGLAGSVYFAACAAGQLINGSLGDRLNPHRFIMAALAGVGGVNVILSLQTGKVVFLILWGVNGFCQSMFWGTLLRLLSCCAEGSQKKTVSTAMGLCSTAAYFLSWVVFALAFQNHSFRPYFLVPGLLALALLPAWIWVARKYPFAETGSAQQPVLPLGQALRTFRKEKLFLVFGLCFLIGAIQEGAVFWLPKLFADVLPSGSDSVLLLMLVPAAKMLGVFVAGGLLRQLGENVRRAAIYLLLTCCTIAVVMLCGRGFSVVTVIWIAVLVMAVNGCNWYTISYLPVCFSGRNLVATLACLLDFSTYLGASVTSGILGVLLEDWGWRALPLLWLVLGVLALLLAAGGAGACLQKQCGGTKL